MHNYSFCSYIWSCSKQILCFMVLQTAGLCCAQPLNKGISTAMLIVFWDEPVILLPAHSASFAHKFISGMQSFYFSESQDAIVLQTCHLKWCPRLISSQLDPLIWETASPRTRSPKIVNESLRTLSVMPLRNLPVNKSLRNFGWIPFIVNPSKFDCPTNFEPFGEIGAYFPVQLSSGSHFAKLENKKKYCQKSTWKT